MLVAGTLSPKLSAHIGNTLGSGDANGDHHVTVADMVLIVHLEGSENYPPAADADGDDTVDALDVARCRSVVLGELPVILQVQPERLAPGDELVVLGQGFGLDVAHCAVGFSASAGQSVASPSSVTDTEIHVTVPADAVSGDVEVQGVPDGPDSNAEFLNAIAGPVSLAQNVQPVFNRYCAAGGCHGGSFPQKGLNLSTTASSYAGLVGVTSAEVAPRNRVVKFDSPSSWLMDTHEDPSPSFGDQMPQLLPPLSTSTIQVLRDWIDQGAANN